MWEEVFNEYNEIARMFSLYNERILLGDYLEYSNELNENYICDLFVAQVISCIVSGSDFYMPQEVLQIVEDNNSEVMNFVKWVTHNDRRYVQQMSATEKSILIQKLVDHCFNEKGLQLLQEICAQDIIYAGNLAPKIKSLLSSIRTKLKLYCLGLILTDTDSDDAIDLYVSRLREAEATGKIDRKPTKVELVFDKQYHHRGALIRGREFKHKNISGARLLETINLPLETDECLNYKTDKNFCQSAILHIGIEATGSSGTGFKISDEYALTCAHVVKGAREVIANVICGDGYPRDRLEGFEVYDVGFGEVVYSNKELDIAIIKTEYCGDGFLSIETRNILPELGEEVIVFGYPLGYAMPQTNKFGPSISFYRGYVSSNQVDNGNSVTFLDVDIKPGNSGSPVISAKTGKVIGIISGALVGGALETGGKMPYMIPIQHFLALNK